MTNRNEWVTWRELQSQPEIWATFGPRIVAQAPDLREWISKTGATEVWFSGAGTSAYIGDFVVAALDGRSGLTMKSVASTDLVAAPRQFLGDGTPLVVSFGRSGNSAETLGVLNVLDNLRPDAPRLNITCNAQSALATRAANNQKVIVLPEETHDKGFAMTSSYSTMLLTALAIFDRSAPDGIFEKLGKALNERMPEFQNLAEGIDTPGRVVMTGSGAIRFAAREAALKIMELTAGQIPALWDSSLGFRHGPKSFVTADTHVFCLLSSDPDVALYDRDLAKELRRQFSGLTVTEIAPPPVNDTWGAVVQVVAAQIIAVILSERLGLNVDNPFAGRGTLTRVVTGVTLYPPAAP